MSTKHATRMSSACWFTQTRSMVVPLYGSELDWKVMTPLGDRRWRSHLVMASTRLSADTSWWVYESGFQRGE